MIYIKSCFQKRLLTKPIISKFIEQYNLCRCMGFIAYTAVLLFDIYVPFYLCIWIHLTMLF